MTEFVKECGLQTFFGGDSFGQQWSTMRAFNHCSGHVPVSTQYCLLHHGAIDDTALLIARHHRNEVRLQLVYVWTAPIPNGGELAVLVCRCCEVLVERDFKKRYFASGFDEFDRERFLLSIAKRRA